MSHNLRKIPTNVLPTKPQTSLRIRAVRTGSSLGASWIAKPMQRIFMWTTKILIRLHECAGWPESSLSAHVRNTFFWRWGLYYHCFDAKVVDFIPIMEDAGTIAFLGIIPWKLILSLRFWRIFKLTMKCYILPCQFSKIPLLRPCLGTPKIGLLMGWSKYWIYEINHLVTAKAGGG